MLRADDTERAIIEAYAAGVNAGIDALSVRPFEYLLLRERPVAWRAQDTVLVVLAMYFRLHDERARRESRLGRLHDALPPAMYAYLTQTGTAWDAPLSGDAVRALPVPGAEICDLRRVNRNPVSGDSRSALPVPEAFIPVGSNAWAISPRRSRKSVAMLANDMHLGLSMPNTWFRLRLLVSNPGRSGSGIDVTGVTLAGTPALVAGSNGHVAWGLTNTYGDWVDLVVLEVDAEDARRYRTPDGLRRFQQHDEVIQVRGAAPRAQVVRSSIWGPVIDSDARGRPRALRWLAHEPEATNLGLLRMEATRTVEQAMAVAHQSGIPPQNLILADRAGNIAWTVMGKIPRRRGYDPLLPSSWADGGRGWFGWLPSSDYPRVVNPPAGAVWTANARVVDGAALRAIGDGGYALGARAKQIRDSLLALDGATEADMLAIQLDDRALFLARWRRFLLHALSADVVAGNARRAELVRIVQAAGQRAVIDDAGYRLVRAFRRELAGRVFAAIVNGCGGLDVSGSATGPRQWEGALWRMLEERPLHLLDPRYRSWQELILAAADAAARTCGDSELARCTWGEANVVGMRHPLSGALPLLARWLDMPAESLPGDTHMPRVQGPAMGASQRFTVAPGHESSGYFHMPGGQSGHPLSPFYTAGHRAWAEGKATPFLPRAEKHRLTLIPAG
jgi:penicillin amidase